MTLDDLAAAVVGVEPGDVEELDRIHRELASLCNSGELNEKALKFAREAMNGIDRLASGRCEVPEAGLKELGDWVAMIQGALLLQDVNDAPAAGDEPEMDPELLNEFISEALEHIENSENSLLALEDNPGDTEAINAVFRAFHTIKGTSGFLNLYDMQKLAHRAENLFDRARKNEIQITGGYADLALEAVDLLKVMIRRFQQHPNESPSRPPTMEDLLARLEAPERFGINGEQLVEDAMAKAVNDIEEAAEMVTENTEAPRIGDLLVASGDVTREQVEEAAKLPGLEPLGTKLVKTGAVSPVKLAKAVQKQKTIKNVCSEETVRVSTDRLENLINMVGELVITHAMIMQNPYIDSEQDRTLSRNVSQLGKITRELQDLSISMRMVPLKGTFNKMARLVRDLSRKSGKNVTLVTEGEDTEIDRNMVESLSDPLVHMIRNAMDHGIESREERAAAGKPDGGTLTLRAYHAAGIVVITLKDDGRGLSRDRILAKAVSEGLADPDRDLSDAEVFKLIFAPGFSTAEKLTDLSGRGVGMDVVKRNIEAMRGRMEVSSTAGEGTLFAIRIPLTLAIIDGMLLKVGNEHYIVPTLNVNQAFRPDPATISTVQGRGEMAMLRGSLIPLFRVHEIFKVSGAVEEPTEAIVLIMEHGGEKCALLVDDLLGQQQVVIKPLNKSLGDVEGISGGAILGDGRVGLILDLAGVMNIARRSGSMIRKKTKEEAGCTTEERR